MADEEKRLMWNAVLPPQAFPQCCYCSSATKQETSGHVANEERGLLQPRRMQYVVGKLAPVVAIEMNASSLYHSIKAKPGPIDDRITTGTNLLQLKSQFSGIGAAAPAPVANRRVGTVQFGMTRMY